MCVPVSQWAYLMLKFKQISMENVNAHIRMRDFPLDLLELMSLIRSECEAYTCLPLSLSLLLCVCLCLRRRVKYTELRLGTKESMWLPQIIWFKMVMKATRNLILLKWTLSPVPVPVPVPQHSYLTAHVRESMWNAMCVTHMKSTSHIVNTINALEIDYNFLWKLFCYLWVCDRSQDVYPHFQWI